MTMSKTERRRRSVQKSATELQEARDNAYSALLTLYTRAEAHAVLCEAVSVEEGQIPKSRGYERESKHGSWFPGHVETESVIHWCLQSHRIIGRNELTWVQLPAPERRVPPPAGAIGFIK